MNQATRDTVFKIMRSRKSRTWKPYEVQQALMKKGIFVSESTLTRKFRRWRAFIRPVPPVDMKKSRTWLYVIV